MKKMTFLAGGLMLWNTAASAQRLPEAADARLRNDCRLASQVLTTGEPHTKKPWALSTIGSCPESGPPALAAAWRRIDTDTAGLTQLYVQSRDMRDQRLFDAAVAGASDAHRPRLIRLLMVSLLVTYVDPHDAIRIRHILSDSDAGGENRCIRSRTAHASGRDGAVPLAPDASSRLQHLVESLAANDPDPQIRFAAGCLRNTPAP
jgi:hypothetical protein